jgi:transposase InsO family protein
VETGKKLKVLHSDRAGEFTSVEFGQYYAERSVECQLTAPYSPQHNGVVERRNQCVVAVRVLGSIVRWASSYVR